MKLSTSKQVIFFILVSLLTSCITNEQETSGVVLPKDTFFDYKIWSEEGKETVTCLFQFRYRRETGRTVKIDPPGRVELDGELIIGDSARITGSYYEIQKPIDEFIGRHRITVFDINNKEYSEEFTFRPFRLLSEIPDTNARDDWTFDFEGMQPIDYLRIIAIDTSFNSDDINEIDTVKNGRLIIPKEKLRTLVNGPVILLLNKEEERSVKNGTQRGGKISITYGIKREFVLEGGTGY